MDQGILDILIDRQIAEDFIVMWASLSELSEVHSKVPVVHKFEISRVTARIFVGIGKGQILTPKEVRCLLLRNWLTPFYDDFGWMRRASKGLDRYLIEDGLSNTILTLPLAWQQEFFLAWFDRFLNSNEDCPNIQRGFEVWWRRAFWRRKEQSQEPARLRITTLATENSREISHVCLTLCLFHGYLVLFLMRKMNINPKEKVIEIFDLGLAFDTWRYM